MSSAIFIDEEPSDVVHAVLSLVQKVQARGQVIDDASLLEIEREVRKSYGKVATYCAGKTPAKTLRKLVRADLARGVSKRSISQTYGISESTVLRYSRSS